MVRIEIKMAGNLCLGGWLVGLVGVGGCGTIIFGPTNQ